MVGSILGSIFAPNSIADLIDALLVAGLTILFPRFLAVQNLRNVSTPIPAASLSVQIFIGASPIEADIRQATQRVPHGALEGLYFEVSREIDPGNSNARNIETDAFALLLCLWKPSPPIAFVDAPARIDVNRQLALRQPLEFLRICCNLVVFDSQLSVLRFIHISVKDILDAKPNLG